MEKKPSPSKTYIVNGKETAESKLPEVIADQAKKLKTGDAMNVGGYYVVLKG